jgi:hypothetical protein
MVIIHIIRLNFVKFVENVLNSHYSFELVLNLQKMVIIHAIILN